MTKSQIWVSAFLLIFLVLFLMVQLTKNDDISQAPTGNPMPQTDISSDAITPAGLISRLGCRGCHGADLEGTRMGPPLQNMAQYWSRDELINYLRNPNSYMDKERFRKFQQDYPGIIMPSFSNVDVKDLGTISDYLLQL
jgi:cytochrome c2